MGATREAGGPLSEPPFQGVLYVPKSPPELACKSRRALKKTQTVRRRLSPPHVEYVVGRCGQAAAARLCCYVLCYGCVDSARAVEVPIWVYMFLFAVCRVNLGHLPPQRHQRFDMQVASGMRVTDGRGTIGGVGGGGGRLGWAVCVCVCVCFSLLTFKKNVAHLSRAPSRARPLSAAGRPARPSPASSIRKCYVQLLVCGAPTVQPPSSLRRCVCVRMCM